MTVYLLYMASPIIIYIIMDIFSPKELTSYEKSKKSFLILCGIVMFLMIGLRHPDNGSGDTRYYYEQWRTFSTIPRSDLMSVLESIDMEKGYLLSVWVLSHIFPHPQMVLVLSAAFFSISVCRFVFKNSEDVVLSMLIFNCLGLFNFMVQGLRQSVAMCICLWAIEQCKKRNLLKFLLLVLIASLFHASALAFITVYFIRNLKINFKGIMIFLIYIAVAFLALPWLFQIINRVLNDDYMMGNISNEGGFIAVLIYLAIIVFALIYRDRKKHDIDLFLYMALIGLATFMLRFTVSAITERISYFFAFSQMIVLPNSIKANYERSTRKALTLIVAALCFGVAIHKATYSILIPYNFYWFGLQ